MAAYCVSDQLAVGLEEPSIVTSYSEGGPCREITIEYRIKTFKTLCFFRVNNLNGQLQLLTSSFSNLVESAFN